MELEICKKKLSETEAELENLQSELERHRRLSEAALEGEEIEKRALDERCKRTLMHLEAEAALRRQYEDKAGRCDNAEEEVVRLKQEVRTM